MAEQKAQASENTSGNYQEYFLPEQGIVVKARTIAEAISKADKQSKEQK